MTLPNGFLDELRDRVPISRIVGRKVTWDNRKSNPGKGDMWAPCPFHQEKTASFHVDDRKGFYYCFGCHAKGDAVTFLREAENMGFLEAVEVLAREAGMAMPERDPEAGRRAEVRSTLADVMEQAVRFYRMQLGTAAAARARDYLERRGLRPAALERFGIGYAPETRQALMRHLSEAGVAPEQMEAAGLIGRRDDGGQPYDRFRGRIMFPIRDARGRCIAFGGRALDPNERAKYLNSPETELFDKGRSLYNVGPARAAAGRGQPLVVAEGYMDVIALVEAGFEAAVAPLGTAVTETQLQMLWRIAPEPVIALDGDAAGLRAGLRLADLALPLLEAGQALRFCVLPAGQDPDDLLRAGGAPAMQRLIDAAQPMAQLLWRRETDGQVLDSPERRAALDKRLRALLKTIRDPSIRAHYAEEFRRLRADLMGLGAPARRIDGRGAGAWSPGGWSPGGGRKGGLRGGFAPGLAAPLAATRSSLLASAADRPDATLFEDGLRESLILAVLITHPALVPRFEPDLEALDWSTSDHAALCDVLLRHAAPDVDAGTLRGEIAREAGPALEKLFALSHVTIAPPVRSTGDDTQALMCVAEELAKLETRQGVRKEIAEAVQEIGGLADETLTWRLGQAAEAHNRALRPSLEDATDLGEDRAALSRQLQNLIDQEIWVKKPS